MNVEGHLRELGQNERCLEDELRVNMSEATNKQRKNNKVSTKDTRSTLGKKLKTFRKNKKKGKKSKSANRRYK